MTLLEKAELFTRGAKRAADAGDDLAFIALSVAAAQHIELAKVFDRANAATVGVKECRG